METIEIKKPSIVKIGEEWYLGNPVKNEFVIAKMKMGMIIKDSEVEKSDLARYLTKGKTNDLQDYEVGDGTPFMITELDEEESLYWDTLLVKYDIALRRTMALMVNAQFMKIIKD